MKAWELLKAMQEDGAKVREPSMGTDYYVWREGEFISYLEGPMDDHEVAYLVKNAYALSIVQEPHNLAWAMEQMRAGKAVCRPGAVFGIVLGDDGEFENAEDGEVVRLSAPSITAMDWRLWTQHI